MTWWADPAWPDDCADDERWSFVAEVYRRCAGLVPPWASLRDPGYYAGDGCWEHPLIDDEPDHRADPKGVQEHRLAALFETDRAWVYRYRQAWAARHRPAVTRRERPALMALHARKLTAEAVAAEKRPEGMAWGQLEGP